MSKTIFKTQQLLEIAKQHGLIRPSDCIPLGIKGEHFCRLVQRGKLEKIGRGVYRPVQGKVSRYLDLAVVCKRAPQGVICLLSALQFYEIGTQMPHKVWLAIDQFVHPPYIDFPATKIMRFSGQSMTLGIENHLIDGVLVKVFNPTKTIADCFKFRNKIGIDVAIEALREWWRNKRGTMDELWKYSKICRISNVIKPYMEMLS